MTDSVIESRITGCGLMLLFLAACSTAAEPPQYTTESPNILIIVADQMRRPAMGFWSDPEYQGALNGASDPVVTPNLDQLASEGIVFTQAIANFPLCSPFRGMLLSGLYPHKNGVSNNTHKTRDVSLRADIETLPEVLQEAGYETALIGKAHWQANKPLFDTDGNYVGTSNPPGGHYIAETDYDTYIPPGAGRQGFEYWYQSISHVHNNPVIYSNDSMAIDGKEDGQQHRKGIYSSVDQANQLIEYIRPKSKKRDANSPFFALWTLDPPHSPYESLEDTDAGIYDEYYKDKTIDELMNRPNAERKIAKKHIRYYFSMVTLIDREIGRVISHLKEEGLYENTIIIFTADHGELMGSHGETGKNKVFEESLGIPFILSYPDRLAHRIDDLMFGIPDVMPTVLGLSGLSESIPSTLQGFDYSPQFLDPNVETAVRPKSGFYFGPKGQLGVRTQRHTYAIDGSGSLLALYDNISDPYQQSSLDLESILEADSALLKEELGSWICATDHAWSASQLHDDMIDYSVQSCQE